MPKPTILLVPGAWHKAICYEKVRTILERAGYSCVAVDLASVDLSKPGTDNGDADADARVISQAMDSILAEGNDVVLVLHSYSGIPGMSAAYSFKDRVSPCIQSVAMIAAFIAPPRTSLSQLLERLPPGRTLHRVNESRTLIEVGDPGAKALFYHDLPLDEAGWWATQVKPQTLISNCHPPSSVGVGWQEIPTSYLVCEDDRAVLPSLQTAMVDDANIALEAAGSSLRIRVEKLFAGHCPFLSMPHETAAYIRRSAGENLESIS